MENHTILESSRNFRKKVSGFFKMKCVFLAKMDKIYKLNNTGKLKKKYWKREGILSARKSGNPEQIEIFFRFTLTKVRFVFSRDKFFIMTFMSLGMERNTIVQLY